MALFDAYAVVDWSARSRPAPPRSPDSIWVAAGERNRGRWRGGEPVWAPTRQAACTHLAALLTALIRRERRVLIGFDFSYGYPRGFADALDLPGAPELAPWRRTWDALVARIVDHDDQRNNRVEVAATFNAALGAPPGPFWATGTANDHPGGALSRTRPVAFPVPLASGARLSEWRVVESRQRARGGRAKSCWQLFGAGSVGSQSLLGIPYVARLRDLPDLAPVSLVWPFETGFTPAPVPGCPAVIHAEVYPGAVPLRRDRHPVLDAAQVLGLVDHLAALDHRGALGALFDVPDLPGPQRDVCVAEEGWILGVR